HKLKYSYDKHHRLAREIYPNGRSIDFTYDTGGRLASVKDPFGYVNTVNYDSEGRLGTIAHSTLGTATFTYDTNDRLSRLKLGNGAYTDYGRGTYGRLTSFDIKQSDNTRIMKHEWQYDNLGRKSAEAGITVTGPNLPSPISFSYDAASRVTSEALNGEWSVNYGYDKAGNRTSVDDGTIERTMGYGVGNRETSVSDNIDPLGYDYKGNVVNRMTLDGAKTFHYGWDAYDRLTSATQMWSGGATVNYDYDTMGRLLRRTKANETTVNYWLGLNKIAEERWSTESGKSLEIFRPDIEESANPAMNGWGVLNGGSETLECINDSSRGWITHMVGNGASFIIGDDWAESLNSNDTKFNDSAHKHLGLWIKNADASHTPFQIQVYAATAHYPNIVLNLMADNGTDGSYTKYLGSALNDGAWHYVEVDLGSFVAAQEAGDSLLAIYGLEFNCYAYDLYVDDIILSGGELERSYGLGYAGAQTGSTGAYDINSAQTQCITAWGKYYYHLNELGSIVSTTNLNGIM
ncbi:RHS repeat protein, partial [bacterium]|nr:RHS repeat protein [bacterium]